MIMCFIWGATWIAIKTGVSLVPPIQFSGARFLAAGALLLAFWWCAGHWVPAIAVLLGVIVLDRWGCLTNGPR
ncbi:hypothetical protein GR304_24215 [Microvirga sp. SYSU G3D207]|uniref:EamA domain-containing protein n=1 Tax=Microvirga arsenatis TaxID=2692265 RepID=A0ABW9Z3X8_9HYPH|nr:hypothetical protein [Microvirga arsenatis]NBJ27402.1 hypothetical protein [Microvirga arsenatis]